MEGQMLGNRYELLEKIGGGGMAIVYKAKCHFLNRFVAIKILRQEYTNDDEFVRRFKIEAQAAASLSHPNIVSIYDVGHEENTHYIVMEYIDGITLKEFLNRRGVLNWRDAIDISIQICSAIEHAHRNHIVHRDIKPHNIMLTNDGIVKVTDFGIARAVSSATITMVGSTIGSVHYFSPEQARGGYIDEKSDIYSLGITLYELVTGKLPFDGDSPVAVAIKHIQDEPESPININPEIPSGVNEIILKAIRKDQTKRYQSAGDMLQDLYRVIKEPNGAFVVSESMEGSPTRRLQAIGTPPPVRKEDFRIKEEKPNNGERKKADKLTVIFAIITAVIVIAISVYVGYSVVKPQLSSDKTSKEFAVKNYEGRNINEVLDELKQNGIKPEVKTESSKTVEKDIIIRQNPKEGVTLKPDGYGTLTLFVSSGPEQVNMPPLLKIEIREAERKLDNANIKYDIQYEFSDVAKDFVTRTDPAEGEKIEPGSTVIVYVSKGPEIKKTRVPNLLNMTESEAKKALAEAGLKIGKIYPEGSNSTGKITNQKPEATTEVNEDTPVDIYFSSSSSATARTNVTKIITLDNPGNYPGDTVNLRVEATPSDTNVMEVLKNETVKKSDFPVRVSIPVPNGGKTNVKIFINNKDVLDDSVILP